MKWNLRLPITHTRSRRLGSPPFLCRRFQAGLPRRRTGYEMALPYYQADPNLPDHHKLDTFCDLLDICDVMATGHLHMLWCGVARVAEHGNVSGWPPRKFARFSRWTGDPKEFLSALISSGFVDKDDDEMRVHNWWERHKVYFTDRERSKRRREAMKAKKDAEEYGLPPTDGTTDGTEDQSLCETTGEYVVRKEVTKE